MDEMAEKTDELKPVRCGCGGEAAIRVYESMRLCKQTDYYLQCKECGIATLFKNTEAEAVTAWNRAMGERTAKVSKGAYDLMRCECGMPVSSNFDFCPHCGARLEWK